MCGDVHYCVLWILTFLTAYFRTEIVCQVFVELAAVVYSV